MQLGTSSPLAHTSAAEWAKKHRDLGLRAVNFPLTCLDNEDRIEEYVNAARAHNLEIAEVGVWRNTMDPDPEKRQQAIEYTINQLKLADRIHARCCVNILGARGPRWDGAYRENDTKETWELGVQTIREIIDRARPEHTYFTIESMPWMIPTGPEEYAQLLEAVDRDRFAVHMDLFNWMVTPKRYFYQEEFIDRSFELLGKWVKSCHLKDVKLEEEYTICFRETAPGEGAVNLRYLIDTACSYDETMSFIIEHLDSDEAYLNSVRYLQQLMQ